MPSYFYHISLELLPSAQPYLTQPDGSELDDTSADPALVLRAAREALKPFRKRRPRTGGNNAGGSSTLSNGVNRSAALAGESVHSVKGAGSSLRRQCTATESNLHLPVRPAHTQDQLSSYQTFQTFTDIQTSLNSPSPLTTAEQVAADQRLDRISFECIDMIPDRERATRHQQQSSGGGGSNNKDNQIAKGIGTNVLGGLATKGRYVPLDQKLSDSAWGIVHLYRDAEESPALCDGDDDPSFLKGSAIARTSKISAPGTRTQFGSRDVSGVSAHSNASTSSSSSGAAGPEDCTTLCILAVPSYLSPADFLGLVGEETRDEVSHFRMIRTARANRYMVLMKFRSGKKAREWQKDWNGKVFNSMEVRMCPGIC